MNKNEDYLDDLLRSVSERDNRRDIADLLHSVREDEDRTRREQESRRRRRDFGKQFFKELEHELEEPEEYDDLVRGFELELDTDEAGIRVDEFPEDLTGNIGGAKEPLTDEQLIENINGIVEGAKSRIEGSEIEGSESDGTEEYDLTDAFAGLSSDEALGEEPVLLNAENPAETEQIQDEASLAMEDSADDLLEMLSGLSEDTDLSDIGAMLKADEEGEEVAADGASDLEMLESIDELAGLVSGKDEKKKKEKKNGFFAKFLKALFGEDEDEMAPVQVSEEKELENLSDENLEILRELDSAEQKPEEPKKGKKKKEKKEKPKKEKKEKPKKEKPKKEKKPKEPDLSPPLPKIPVILISVMAASIFLLILLGSNFMSYSGDLSASKASYRNGRYVEAYTTISGRNVKSKDQQFYNQCAVMAMIEEEYQAYVSLMDVKEYTMALDSLIRGIGRYDKYYEKAVEYDILPEYNELGQKIELVLGEQFGMTADQARELYGLRRRDDYSIGVRQILASLGLE